VSILVHILNNGAQSLSFPVASETLSDLHQLGLDLLRVEASDLWPQRAVGKINHGRPGIADTGNNVGRQNILACSIGFADKGLRPCVKRDKMVPVGRLRSAIGLLVVGRYYRHALLHIGTNLGQINPMRLALSRL